VADAESHGRKTMTVLYGIAGCLALVLIVYLFVALLKPEIFE
jgi:K+-transporting ATPase KdpF subunit